MVSINFSNGQITRSIREPIDWEDIIDFSVRHGNQGDCVEVYPCHHPTTITYRRGKETLQYQSNYVDGRQIKFLFLKFGRPVPDHFSNYDLEHVKPIEQIKSVPFGPLSTQCTEDS